MRVWGMHERTQFKLTAADRAELEAVVANRNSPQKHVWRAKIVLLTAEGHGTSEIKRQPARRHAVSSLLAQPRGCLSYGAFDVSHHQLGSAIRRKY